MPYNEDKGFHEPAETREDLARQTAAAAEARQAAVDVEVEGASALVDAAVADLPAEETNQAIAEARAPAQEKVDALRAEAEGVEPGTGEPAKTSSSSSSTKTSSSGGAKS
jgi:hypothetical protein